MEGGSLLEWVDPGDMKHVTDNIRRQDETGAPWVVITLKGKW